ncbi:MAG: glutamate-semialdehyde -aminomutase [Gaiellales bacterium]|nr:glutamate-semialdehyde -aminomutase [Gaiellales bacterium]
MTALVHGHRHPAIVEAVSRALEDGLSFGLPTAAEVDLAGHLSERIGAVDSVRFANSGTEAVMSALRIARAFTGRPMILRCAGAYHGTYDPILPEGAPGVAPSTWSTVVSIPFDDVEALRTAVAAHAGELGAVIVDLMPNRPGLVPASREFAAVAREETERHGILLIVDEVITFRLGVGGLHQEYGVRPDLVTLGKTIGGGLPVGAVGGREDVMALTDPRRRGYVEHGGTFTANPLTMRAGLAALELLDAGEIARINRLGDALREELGALGQRVNGRGSLMRIMSPEPDDLWWRLYRSGILIGRNGLAGMSTPMDESTVEEIVRRFRKAVA